MYQSDLEGLERCRTFCVTLTPEEKKGEWWPVPAHDLVLRPLLAKATEGWVYGIQKDSEIFEVAGQILEDSGSRFRICLGQECITSFEYFWNASSGRRGSIVILVPLSAVDWSALFKNCRLPSVQTNFSIAHTPAAVKYAKYHSKNGVVALLLSATNGFEWLHVMAPKEHILALYEFACGSCLRRH